MRYLIVVALSSLSLASCSSEAAGKFVSESEFEAKGLRWPLKVESGTIGCDNEARWFETGGVRYALNGTASGRSEYQAIEPIWAEDARMNADLAKAGITNTPPLRVNIGDMIDEAGKLCS